MRELGKRTGAFLLGVSSKAANGSGPELLEVLPDSELFKQGLSGPTPDLIPNYVLDPVRFVDGDRRG